MNKVFILMSDGDVVQAFTSINKVRAYIYDKYDGDTEIVREIMFNLDNAGYDIDSGYDLIETELD